MFAHAKRDTRGRDKRGRDTRGREPPWEHEPRILHGSLRCLNRMSSKLNIHVNYTYYIYIHTWAIHIHIHMHINMRAICRWKLERARSSIYTWTIHIYVYIYIYTYTWALYSAGSSRDDRHCILLLPSTASCSCSTASVCTWIPICGHPCF